MNFAYSIDFFLYYSYLKFYNDCNVNDKKKTKYMRLIGAVLMLLHEILQLKYNQSIWLLLVLKLVAICYCCTYENKQKPSFFVNCI